MPTPIRLAREVRRATRNVAFFSGTVVTLRATLRTIAPDTVLSLITVTNVMTILATRGLSVRTLVSERNDLQLDRHHRGLEALRRWVYPWADVVTANTHGALSDLERFVPKPKLAYLPNPVRVPVSHEKVAYTAPTFVCAARLAPPEGDRHAAQGLGAGVRCALRSARGRRRRSAGCRSTRRPGPRTGCERARLRAAASGRRAGHRAAGLQSTGSRGVRGDGSRTRAFEAAGLRSAPSGGAGPVRARPTESSPPTGRSCRACCATCGRPKIVCDLSRTRSMSRSAMRRLVNQTGSPVAGGWHWRPTTW